MSFGRGVSPGFIVHADQQTGQAWVQIGLTAADLQNPSTLFFAMDPDKAAGDKTVPNSGVRYYNKKLFKSKIAIFDGVQPLILDSEVAVTPDTGAHTTVHTTDNSSSAQTYDVITDWADNDHRKGKLKSGLQFFLRGTTTDGQSAQFFDFITADTPSTDPAHQRSQSSKRQVRQVGVFPRGSACSTPTTWSTTSATLPVAAGWAA